MGMGMVWVFGTCGNTIPSVVMLQVGVDYHRYLHIVCTCYIHYPYRSSSGYYLYRPSNTTTEPCVFKFGLWLCISLCLWASTFHQPSVSQSLWCPLIPTVPSMPSAPFLISNLQCTYPMETMAASDVHRHVCHMCSQDNLQMLGKMWSTTSWQSNIWLKLCLYWENEVIGGASCGIQHVYFLYKNE